MMMDGYVSLFPEEYRNKLTCNRLCVSVLTAPSKVSSHVHVYQLALSNLVKTAVLAAHHHRLSAATCHKVTPVKGHLHQTAHHSKDVLDPHQATTQMAQIILYKAVAILHPFNNVPDPPNRTVRTVFLVALSIDL
jgi:tetrahydromethanopterin S-methyltransferase subunit C